MGQLYIVATPIGNLEDITLRALRILGEVSLIAAEDTRTARVLLRRHGIRARLTALTDHNAARAVPLLLDALAADDIALISEAGTPVVSDPGYELVTAAVAAGHRVTPIPGPSAVLAALVVSGLPAREFTYLGFLPHGGADRRRLLATAATEPRTVVVFESPHRLRAALQDISAAYGNRPIAVCRELTKLYEEVFRGTAVQALDHFAAPRGEFTIVLAGATDREPVDEPAALADLAVLKRRGKGAREATEEVSRRSGIARRRLYRAWHELKE
ncbi:MAG: 16S rRNA (cytidine(1402)-2'-O)-methyltransferase [Dehalococcoidia bacterium]